MTLVVKNVFRREVVVLHNQRMSSCWPKMNELDSKKLSCRTPRSCVLGSLFLRRLLCMPLSWYQNPDIKTLRTVPAGPNQALTLCR